MALDALAAGVLGLPIGVGELDGLAEAAKVAPAGLMLSADVGRVTTYAAAAVPMARTATAADATISALWRLRFGGVTGKVMRRIVAQ